MPSFHINPDELQNFSRLLDDRVRLMLDEEFRLNQAISLLDMAWQGGSAAEFLNEAQTLKAMLHERAYVLYQLSRQLSREADRWEESDQNWVVEYRKLFISKVSGGG